MTPFQLDILLHYYCKCHDHYAVLTNVPIWAETRDWFLDQNLLTHSGPNDTNSYVTTKRADAFINHILNLPLPVEKTTWEIPE